MKPYLLTLGGLSIAGLFYVAPILVHRHEWNAAPKSVVSVVHDVEVQRLRHPSQSSPFVQKPTPLERCTDISGRMTIDSFNFHLVNSREGVFHGEASLDSCSYKEVIWSRYFITNSRPVLYGYSVSDAVQTRKTPVPRALELSDVPFEGKKDSDDHAYNLMQLTINKPDTSDELRNSLKTLSQDYNKLIHYVATNEALRCGLVKTDHIYANSDAIPNVSDVTQASDPFHPVVLIGFGGAQPSKACDGVVVSAQNQISLSSLSSGSSVGPVTAKVKSISFNDSSDKADMVLNVTNRSGKVAEVVSLSLGIDAQNGWGTASTIIKNYHVTEGD